MMSCTRSCVLACLCVDQIHNIVYNINCGLCVVTYNIGARVRFGAFENELILPHVLLLARAKVWEDVLLHMYIYLYGFASVSHSLYKSQRIASHHQSKIIFTFFQSNLLSFMWFLDCAKLIELCSSRNMATTTLICPRVQNKQIKLTQLYGVCRWIAHTNT